MRIRFVVAVSLLVLLAAGPAVAGEIKVGLFADLSGASAGVGRPYAEGVQDAAKYINESGGIGGDTLVPVTADICLGRQGPLGAYARLTRTEHIVALLSWGANVVETLADRVAADKIPTLSASAARLWDPKNAPYSFFASPDFTIRAMAALRHFKASWSQSRPPRLALVYPNHPYGLDAINTVRDFALAQGFELVVEENVDLDASDAAGQIARLKEESPDFVWVGGSANSVTAVLRDAAASGLAATILLDVWGAPDYQPGPAGAAAGAGGAYLLSAVVPFGQDVPGMKIIAGFAAGAQRSSHYIRGFSAMLVLAKAIEFAQYSGEVTGQSVKAALESLRDFDPLGLSPPVSFSPEDHRGVLAVLLYRFENGKPVLAAAPGLPR
jgi:branched-chain amino acid transport system substrate-binding protein